MLHYAAEFSNRKERRRGSLRFYKLQKINKKKEKNNKNVLAIGHEYCEGVRKLYKHQTQEKYENIFYF